MTIRHFKSTAFSPISPSRVRPSGYFYVAPAVDVVDPAVGPLISLVVNGNSITPDELFELPAGEYTAVITNLGDETLTISSVVLEDEDEDGFAITQPEDTTLEPGVSTTFTITVP